MSSSWTQNKSLNFSGLFFYSFNWLSAVSHKEPRAQPWCRSGQRQNILEALTENKFTYIEKGQYWLSSAKSNSQAITNNDLNN